MKLRTIIVAIVLSISTGSFAQTPKTQAQLVTQNQNNVYQNVNGTIIPTVLYSMITSMIASMQTTVDPIGPGATFASGLRIPAPNLAPLSPSSSELSITLSTQPTYSFPENGSTCATEFAGDFSKTVLPFCYNVGSAALGTQTAGYFWNPATTPHNDFINMAGGFSGGSGVTLGRTGWVDYTTLIQHTGQGDAGMLRFWGNIASPMNSGETNFLQGKAIFALAGNWGAGVAGGYEQGVGDLVFQDNGFETAVVGTSYRFYRTINTTTYGSVWIGDYYHSLGSKAIDCGWCLAGPATVGLDTVLSTGLSAAVNLGPDQVIALNSVASPIGGINWYGNVTGNATISYVTVAGAIEINNIGDSLQVLASQVQTNGEFVAGGVINAIGGFYANSVQGVSSSSCPMPTLTLGIATTCSAVVAATSLALGGATIGSNALAVTGSIQTNAFTANGAVATAISSVGPTGSHTTVQEWFTVTDNGGTVRYIPAF